MNSKFTSIITFIIGLVLIIWPSLVKEYIVLIIGALILSVGIASLIYYLMEKKKGNINNILMINTVVDCLFGIVLLVFPNFFAGLVMFIFGIILLYFGISEIVKLVRVSKSIQLHWGLYLVPVLTTLGGVLLFFYPNRSGNWLFIIFGIILLAYSISDIISSRMISCKRKEMDNLKELEENSEVL